MIGRVGVSARKTNRQAVVTARGKLELDPGHEIGQLFVVIDRASRAFLAFQDAVLDLVVLDRTGPTGEVLPIEDRVETLRRVSPRSGCLPLVRFRRRRCSASGAHGHESEVESDRERGLAAAISVIFEDGVIHDEFAVQDRWWCVCPLESSGNVFHSPMGLSALTSGSLPVRGGYVPEAAGTLIGLQPADSRISKIPDLHLRRALR